MNYKCAVCGIVEELTSSQDDMMAEEKELFGANGDPKDRVILCDPCHKAHQIWLNEHPVGQATKAEIDYANRDTEQLKPFRKICEPCTKRQGNRCGLSIQSCGIYSKSFIVPLACIYRLEHIVHANPM